MPETRPYPKKIRRTRRKNTKKKRRKGEQEGATNKGKKYTSKSSKA